MGVKESGTVHVNRQGRTRAKSTELFDGIGQASGVHVGVLHHDGASGRLMVALDLDGVGNLIKWQVAIDIVHERKLHAGVAGRGTHLKGHDVGVAAGDHGVAGFGVKTHGNLIGHNPRGHEDGGRLADELGVAHLELLVGSAPNPSSPTVAFAMAERMAAVGWVSVSLRTSILRSMP